MVILTTSVVSSCIALLFAAALNGIYGVRPRRIFSGGFAIGAWAYLGVVLGHYDISSIGRYLVTTKAIEYVESLVPEQNPNPYGVYVLPPDTAEYYREKIRVIGHCSFAVLVGIFSGLMAQRFNASKAAPALAVSNERIGVASEDRIPRPIGKRTKTHENAANL